MTVTVLVLLGLTLWLTSFEKMRVTITKPADTDPPYTIRKGEPLEVEGIVDDGGNIYQQPRRSYQVVFSKTPKRPAASSFTGKSDVPVDRNTKRFRQRLWHAHRLSMMNIVYITATRARDRAGRIFGQGHRTALEQHRAGARRVTRPTRHPRSKRIGAEDLAAGPGSQVLQTASPMPSLTNRTEPSMSKRFAPPGWNELAPMNESTSPNRPTYSHAGLFGGMTW